MEINSSRKPCTTFRLDFMYVHEVEFVGETLLTFFTTSRLLKGRHFYDIPLGAALPRQYGFCLI
jgi:hypothetical protein